MRGIAAKAFARGMNVVRLNQRNCGDTEHLSAGLFHSGLTADARHVIDELSAVDGIAGDRRGRLFARRQPRAEAGRRVRRRRRRRRCARSRRSRRSSRSASASARSSGPATVLYQWNFVRDLKRADAAEGPLLAGPLRSRQARRRSGPCASSTRPTRRRTSASRTPRTTTTAPARCASSIASACRRSIITAEDDPFVPPEPFRDPRVTGQPAHHPAPVQRTAATAASSARVRRRRRRVLGGGPDRGLRRSGTPESRMIASDAPAAVTTQA